MKLKKSKNTPKQRRGAGKKIASTGANATGTRAGTGKSSARKVAARKTKVAKNAKTG